MANKSHATRQKLSFRLEPSKPHNPVALKARQLPAGRHQKTPGGKRASEKRAVEKAAIEEEIPGLEDGERGDRSAKDG